MLKIFLLTISFITVITCSAQTSSLLTDTIRIEKKGGYKFYQGEQQLKMKDLKSILKSNDLAYRNFKSASSSSTIGTVLGYSGGFLIGWSIGTAISGKDKANWTPAIIGAGLTAISIPFAIKANKKIKRAVETFNGSKRERFETSSIQLNLQIKDSGVGVALKF